MKDQDLSQVIILMCIMLALMITLHVMRVQKRNDLSGRIDRIELRLGGGE